MFSGALGRRGAYKVQEAEMYGHELQIHTLSELRSQYPGRLLSTMPTFAPRRGKLCPTWNGLPQFGFGDMNVKFMYVILSFTMH
jgi:hypothetical protein